jgi:hypothetical protein
LTSVGQVGRNSKERQTLVSFVFDVTTEFVIDHIVRRFEDEDGNKLATVALSLDRRCAHVVLI